MSSQIPYTILIPFAPDTINSAVSYGNNNWMAVSSLKKKWQSLAELHFSQAIAVGELPDRFLFPIEVEFDLYFTKIRTRDEDNYFVMSKGIIDAITGLNMIEDDSNTFVNFGGVNLHIDEDRPRVIVQIKQKFPFNVDMNGFEIKEYAE